MTTQIKNSAINLQIDINADGADLIGGTIPRELSWTGSDILITGTGTNVYTFPASTSTLASQTLAETFTNKTLTSPIISSTVASTVGSIERDASAFYSTPVSGARGVSPSTMYSIVASGDFSLGTASGVQSAFASTGDVWTLAASTTYFFEGIYNITRTTNTATTAMAFALGGGASITSILYYAFGMTATGNDTTGTAQSSVIVDQVSSTVILATGITGGWIKFSGVIRMNAGGTVTPQINFSATTVAPVMKANSYIIFWPIGTNTNNTLGNVG